jgi:AcrR family transcriptional regulator
MPRPFLKLSPPPAAPARGVRAATFKLLLDTAMDLIRADGHIPSVAEVAVRSQVSRATAYRYFPSRSALITAVIESSLGPVRTFSSDSLSGRERVQQLFKQTFPRFKEFEPQLRAAAQLALEQWALERAGLLEEAVLELGAEGFDRTASDGDSDLGICGVVHVLGMVPEVGVLQADGLRCRLIGGRLLKQFVQRLE